MRRQLNPNLCLDSGKGIYCSTGKGKLMGYLIPTWRVGLAGKWWRRSGGTDGWEERCHEGEIPVAAAAVDPLLASDTVEPPLVPRTRPRAAARPVRPRAAAHLGRSGSGSGSRSHSSARPTRGAISASLGLLSYRSICTRFIAWRWRAEGAECLTACPAQRRMELGATRLWPCGVWSCLMGGPRTELDAARRRNKATRFLRCERRKKASGGFGGVDKIRQRTWVFLFFFKKKACGSHFQTQTHTQLCQTTDWSLHLHFPVHNRLSISHWVSFSLSHLPSKRDLKGFQFR